MPSTGDEHRPAADDRAGPHFVGCGVVDTPSATACRQHPSPPGAARANTAEAAAPRACVAAEAAAAADADPGDHPTQHAAAPR
ncbi:MAG: hypothetical protein ACRDT8_22845 [Micromonosporaceae bacterium]